MGLTLGLSAPQINISNETLYCVTLAFIKFSILSLYVVIFPGKTMRRLAIAVGAFVAIWTLTASLAAVLRCVPIAALWDMTIINSYCINYGILVLVHNICNIITDLILLAMPIYPVSRLKLPTEKKVFVLLSFLLGAR